MTLAEFKRTLAKQKPPGGLSPALAALWWAAKDDWDRAHKLVMEEGVRDCAWVHAYLHRIEGDLSNAGYWYRQAHRPAGQGAFEREWEAIAGTLLASART
jgi:hypothetical protein